MSTVVENVIILSSEYKKSDINLLFGNEPVHFTNTTELSVLLKELGIYKSTSEARRAGRVGEIDSGWAELKASKKKRVFIWNPNE